MAHDHHAVDNNPRKETLFALVCLAMLAGIISLIGVSAYFRGLEPKPAPAAEVAAPAPVAAVTPAVEPAPAAMTTDTSADTTAMASTTVTDAAPVADAAPAATDAAATPAPVAQ